MQVGMGSADRFAVLAEELAARLREATAKFFAEHNLTFSADPAWRKKCHCSPAEEVAMNILMFGANLWPEASYIEEASAIAA